MQMQIRALRDLYLQKDRLVQNLNVVAMSRGADARGIDTLANTSCPYVICLLYTFNTCFEIISGLMNSLTTILSFVCFVLSTIRVEGSSTSPFISCSSKFTLLSAIALTKSIGVLCTTDCCPVWRYLLNLGPHPTTETMGTD